MGNKYQLIIRNKLNRKEKIICDTNNIEEMDNYTRGYVGYADLLYDNCVSYMDNDIYLISRCKNKIKYLQILFMGDILDNESIKYMYLELLKSKRYLILESDIRYINMGIVINKYMKDYDLERVVFAYFKDYPYYKVRNAYLFLVRHGLIKRRIDNDIIYRDGFNKYVPSTCDEYLENLINTNNYEEIFNNYDLDDLSSKDINYIVGYSKIRRR